MRDQPDRTTSSSAACDLVEHSFGPGFRWCRTHLRMASECGERDIPMTEHAALVQVGWMLSPDLAAEFDLTPLSDEYLITLEQAEQDGGIKDEYADRVIPVYRKADDAADQPDTAATETRKEPPPNSGGS